MYCLCLMAEFERDVPQNCWQYKECPIKIREQCLIYRFNMGKECWFISKANKESFTSWTGDKCFNCPWFNKYNHKTIP